MSRNPRRRSEEIPEPFVTAPAPLTDEVVIVDEASAADSGQVVAQQKHAPPAVVEASAKPPEESQIPVHRRCPLCWGRRKGYGTAYRTNQPGEEYAPNVRTRYYKCTKSLSDLGPCGFTWTATVETKVTRIESRPVQLDTRDN